MGAVLFYEVITKFNPYHDKLGRFTNANGSISAKFGVTLSTQTEEYLRQYTNGKYDASCKISQEIEETGEAKKYIEEVSKYRNSEFKPDSYLNLERDLEQTKLIMDAIDGQQVSKDFLVRIEYAGTEKNVGDEFIWGIRSTSRDADFAKKVIDGKDEGLKNKLARGTRADIYEIVGDKKHLDISGYSKFDQQESLVKGKFRVIGKKDVRYEKPVALGFDEASKIYGGLNQRYTYFTSKKGNAMVRDNETGQTYKKQLFDQFVYYPSKNGGMMVDKFTFNSYVEMDRKEFREYTIYQIEQVL